MSWLQHLKDRAEGQVAGFFDPNLPIEERPDPGTPMAPTPDGDTAHPDTRDSSEQAGQDVVRVGPVRAPTSDFAPTVFGQDVINAARQIVEASQRAEAAAKAAQAAAERATAVNPAPPGDTTASVPSAAAGGEISGPESYVRPVADAEQTPGGTTEAPTPETPGGQPQ